MYLEFIETMVFSETEKSSWMMMVRSLQTYMLENYENGTPLPILVVAKRYAVIERGEEKWWVRIIYYARTSQEDYICFLSILKIEKTQPKCSRKKTF